MSVNDYVDIRSRIDRFKKDKDFKMLLKALYLLGAMQAEMLWKKTPSDKGKVYGPTGNDAYPKIVPVWNKQIKTIAFIIRTANVKGKSSIKGKPRTVLLPIDPKCEKWTKELYNYFRGKDDNHVFPWQRVTVWKKNKKYKTFEGLQKDNAPKAKKLLDFNLDWLRKVRMKELEDKYGFTKEELQAYGFKVLKEKLNPSEIEELQRQYVGKLCNLEIVSPKPTQAEEIISTSELDELLENSRRIGLPTDRNWVLALCSANLIEAIVYKKLNDLGESCEGSFEARYDRLVKAVKEKEKGRDLQRLLPLAIYRGIRNKLDHESHESNVTAKEAKKISEIVIDLMNEVFKKNLNPT